ncbi:MAG: hypothetical protein RLO12_02180 [Fulvivirga sp.]
MIDILEKSKSDKKFIGIWLYNDDDGFWSGIVKDYTDDFVILQHYTKYGKPDGLIIEKIENIESIDFDDDYSRAMEYLIKNSELIDVDSEVEIKINNPETWQKDILDDQIGKKDRIVRVQINHNNYYSGFVEWCDEDSLILALIGDEGQGEGKSIYKIEDINAIRVNDLENRKKLLLYNWKKASR